MANQQLKRERLFDKFSDQLLLLRREGIITQNFTNQNPYLCPICLREFSKNDLITTPQNNYLTLEDAPPDSLGGSKIALTCKQCNSECGHKIDFHLTELIRETDDSYFIKGTKRRGTIDFEGKPLTMELTSQGGDTGEAYHRIKSNDPNRLQRFIHAVKTGQILNFKPAPSRVDPLRVGYALLKANYIITFSKFGYIFLLDKEYDAIRQQLLNPDKQIFPYSPFIKNQVSSSSVGTYYVVNKGMESIFNVFSLKTEYSETTFAGLFPVPTIKFEDFRKSVDLQKDARGVLQLDARPYDPNADLFTNTVEIKKVANWIAKAKS